jgi:hypothetical protein
MDNHSALLCLEAVVATYVNKAMDDVVKGVVVVVEQHQIPFVFHDYVSQDVFLDLGFCGLQHADFESLADFLWRKDMLSCLCKGDLCPRGA